MFSQNSALPGRSTPEQPTSLIHGDYDVKPSVYPIKLAVQRVYNHDNTRVAVTQVGAGDVYVPLLKVKDANGIAKYVDLEQLYTVGDVQVLQPTNMESLSGQWWIDQDSLPSRAPECTFSKLPANLSTMPGYYLHFEPIDPRAFPLIEIPSYLHRRVKGSEYLVDRHGSSAEDKMLSQRKKTNLQLAGVQPRGLYHVECFTWPTTVQRDCIVLDYVFGNRKLVRSYRVE